MNHAPTPWVIHDKENFASPGIRIGTLIEPVATVVEAKSRPGAGEANANFIVQACNSYERREMLLSRARTRLLDIDPALAKEIAEEVDRQSSRLLKRITCTLLDRDLKPLQAADCEPAVLENTNNARVVFKWRRQGQGDDYIGVSVHKMDAEGRWFDEGVETSTGVWIVYGARFDAVAAADGSRWHYIEVFRNPVEVHPRSPTNPASGDSLDVTLTTNLLRKSL